MTFNSDFLGRMSVGGDEGERHLYTFVFFKFFSLSL